MSMSNWYAGRRGGGLHCGSQRGANSFVQPRTAPRLLTPAPPLGPLLDSISVDELSREIVDQKPEVRVTDCEVVASYNWLHKPTPSIAVPGLPPRWTPLDYPPRIKKDPGKYYRDRNAARYPDHPMEPAVEAVMKSNQDGLDTDQPIGIVACVSTLGNLLRFARRDHHGFRMLVEIVGTTVHLIRRENSPRDTIPNIRGHGHTFPEAYTTWDSCVRGSASHQRILRYRLAGFCCLVRFEGDGYLPAKAEDLELPVKKEPHLKKTDSMEALKSSFAETSVSTDAISGDGVELQMALCSVDVPQRALFDLKTRSINRKENEASIIEAELPRMWLAQVPNFILAYHNYGIFRDINVRDMRGELADWEATKNENGDLHRFAALLRRIVDLARSREDGKMEITCDEGVEFLRVREQMPGVPPAFSGGTGAKWKRWLGGDSEAGGDLEDSGGPAKGPANKTLFDQRPEDDDGHSSSWRDHASDGHNNSDDEWESSCKDLTACDSECRYCGRCLPGSFVLRGWKKS